MNTELLNIFLMIAACALAYIIPFELVLLSYAFLGPAHYLTQISWMHDRQYFTGHAFFIWPVIALTLALVFIGYSPLGVFAILALSSALLFKERSNQILCFIFVFAALMLANIFLTTPMAFFLAFLPTVLHVYVFTAAFILLGALKKENIWAAGGFGALIGCGLSFFITPPEGHFIISESFVEENMRFFSGISYEIKLFFSSFFNASSNAVMGFLSFAYTYHYLNWFSKVEIIKWHQIPSSRLLVIGALYLASIGLYLYDYGLGFTVLIFLSLLHVYLELPLNILTFKEIGKRLSSI